MRMKNKNEPRPVAMYRMSDDSGIAVYGIEHGPEDTVLWRLVGFGKEPSVRRSGIRNCDGRPYFTAYRLKIYLDECVRCVRCA